MTTFAVVVLVLIVPLGAAMGVWIGRSWKSLPELRPGAVVRFRGPNVGVEHRLNVMEIVVSDRGVTASLAELKASKP